MSHPADPSVAIGTANERWPALGLGTWRLGESTRQIDREVALIERAIEIGYRLFDTAEMYGDGGAERVLGRALGRALRHGVVRRGALHIVSKVYPHHADPAGLRRACDASRRRLQTDTIDLYLLHWRGATPLADTVRGFEQLVRSGAIRHWGVSNFDTPDMAELFDQPDGPACAANQVYYSLSERGVEFDLLPWMRRRCLPVMAYCPIDGGRIAGHPRLAHLASTIGLPPAQLALAWLLRQRGVIAIPKAGSEAHLKENWRSREVEVPAATWSTLDEVFPAPNHKRALAMR
ncbi:MAG: aldo/keto reductase [Ideonella sp.]|nr:aldo/keto reductase [Ideonella sp.]MCC7458903.1 aldo/keto reductase [Nitrospira sp.]